MRNTNGNPPSKNGFGTNKSLKFITGKFLLNPQGKIVGRHWLTFAGMALGVFALLSVSSVMNGFDKDMRQRIVGTRSEIRLDNKDARPLENYEELCKQLENRPDIMGVSPVLRNELMLVNGSAMAATVCFGIDYERQPYPASDSQPGVEPVFQ
jgi:ABC-type lipoprotein release transport system permease subunit